MADESHARIESDLRAHISQLTGGRGSVEEGSFARLTGGFDTQVFAFRVSGAESLPSELVLRVFRENEAHRTILESAVHNASADAGHPVPRVFSGFSGERIAGRPFIIMERVKGSTLLQTAANPAAMAEIPKLMGRVHARLHSIDASGLIRALERGGVDTRQLMADNLVGWVAEAVEACGVKEMKPLVEWLQENAPPVPDRLSVCHGDFHPGNMMVEDMRLTGIIDWGNVKFGRPEYDVGVTQMLFTCGPLEATGGVDSEEATRAILEQAAAAYIHFYTEHGPLNEDLAAYYGTLRAAHALVRVMGRGSDAAPRFIAPDGYAWGLPSALRAIRKLIERSAGISISA